MFSFPNGKRFILFASFPTSKIFPRYYLIGITRAYSVCCVRPLRIVFFRFSRARAVWRTILCPGCPWPRTRWVDLTRTVLAAFAPSTVYTWCVTFFVRIDHLRRQKKSISFWHAKSLKIRHPCGPIPSDDSFLWSL